MKEPKEIYLAFEDGFIAQSSNVDKDANGKSVFLSGLKPYKYIRADIAEHFYNLALEDVRKECQKRVNKLKEYIIIGTPDDRRLDGTRVIQIQGIIDFIDNLTK
jgi:methyltransferase-like protein